MTIKTKQRLKDYSLWYYFRYFPSNKKLENKLLEKSDQNRELVDEVISEINHLLQEKEIIRSKIINYINKGKNINYIKNKLREKLFNINSYGNILNTEFIEEGKSILDESRLYKKIENYKLKGKSKNYIKQKLIERSEDKMLVENYLEEIFLDNDELESLKKEYEKIKEKYDKNKVIQKLIGKGFRYDDIKNIIL